MSDKQNPNDPAYDWLYSGDRDPHSPDSEPTRAIRRPGESADDTPDGPPAAHDLAEASGGAEPTRVLGPLGGAAAAANPYSPPTDTPPSDEMVPAPPTSFGGVYPAPAAAGAGVAASTGSRPPAPPVTQGGGYGKPPTSLDRGNGRPSRPRRPGGRLRKGSWWARVVIALLAAWVVFLVAVPLWAWQHITKVDASPSGNRPADTPGTTYLLVGSDSRAGLTKKQRGEYGTGDAAGQRTDTIIMLHVPENSGPRLLLSIPRDSYVDIPGHGHNKINAAYSIGGPKLLVQTVEQATGVRVDDYVEVGFTGFVDVVDAVGGITVCPETSINDPKAGHLKLKKGCQQVDGVTALDYSRSRAFALGDITRAQHQREVIAAVGHEAASWKTLVLPWRYLKVNKAAADSLTIGDNVGPLDLARFAWAMAHTGGDGAKRCVVPYTSLGTQTSVGSVVEWDQSAADAIFKDIRADNTSAIHCSATGQ